MAGIRRSTSSSSIIFHHLRSETVPLKNLLRLVITRSNSTSAAAQPLLEHDYSYYWKQSNSESNASRDHPELFSVVHSNRSSPPRGVQWVFIGNPEANKHVYADKLSKMLEVPHITMASLVRQDLSPRSSLYKQIADAVNQGKLVPEEIILGLLAKRLGDGYYEGETGFILDGIPRTKIQAENLDKLVHIDLVLNFKSAKDCLLEHHADQLFSCSHNTDGLGSSGFSSLDKHKQDRQSKYFVHNLESAWKGKARSHAKQKKDFPQLKQLEDYYRKQKKLIDFHVCNAPGENWQGLLAALNL